MTETVEPDFTAMTVQLLSAYFANNQVPAGDIPAIIESTRTALERKASVEVPATPEHVPAVTVRKSLGSRDHIISMIDGKPYKSLKRHIGTHGLTPAEYRARYKLAKDYPMVAAGYSEHRREVAKRLGLGRKKAEAITVPTEAETTILPAAPQRGRKPSAAIAAPVATAKSDAPTKAKPGRKPRAKAGEGPVANVAVVEPKANKPAKKTGAPGKDKPSVAKTNIKSQATKVASDTAPEAASAKI